MAGYVWGQWDVDGPEGGSKQDRTAQVYLTARANQNEKGRGKSDVEEKEGVSIRINVVAASP